MNCVPCSCPHPVAVRPADHGPSGSLGNSLCPPSCLTSAHSTCPLLTVFQPEQAYFGLRVVACTVSSILDLHIATCFSSFNLELSSSKSDPHCPGTIILHFSVPKMVVSVFYVTLSSPDYKLFRARTLCVLFIAIDL